MMAVSFDSGGLRLAGDLFLPPGASAQEPAGVPGVVVASGFGGVKEMLLHEYGAALAEAGVACLAYDYPNFGASAGERRQHVDPRRMLRSYADAVHQLASRPEIDASRIGVWGPSLAGGFALATAARVQQVRSAAAIVPFIRVPLDRPDLPLALEVVRDLLGRAAGRAPRMVPVAGPPGSLAAMNTDGAEEWVLRMAADAPAFRNEVTTASMLNMLLLSNRAAAQRVRIPLRVILAENDAITPAAMVRRAVRDVPGVDVVSFPETHFELLTTYNDQVKASIVDWFVRTL